MANRDLQLLKSVSESIEKLIPVFLAEDTRLDGRAIEHPLDDDIRQQLTAMANKFRDTDDDYEIFAFAGIIKELWNKIIEKSIKCLRFFDGREPFLNNSSKRPVAYGVKELGDYFDKYTQFESMLYGGGKYYRDHVVHVFRVWLLGLDCLLDNEAAYLKRISIQQSISVNSLEKISIWSMIALTHDLGYPLEKAQGIIEKTKEMMRSFVSNPTLSLDLSFNGIQTNMNDFVVRFMSSKMHEIPPTSSKKEDTKGETKKFVARLQPKYYFKFQKSLEGYNHGILSATIIYKLLIFFLESDFNINEDYVFDEEEARQFYIRREILRTIASHTCHDVYHLDMMNFSFLLIMVDDAQEWGRKRISELYVKKSSSYQFDSISPYFGGSNYDYGEYVDNGVSKAINKFVTKEKFSFPMDEIDNLKGILKGLWHQRERYLEIFRDGQDMAKRNFVFEKACDVVLEENKAVTFSVRFVISNDKRPEFCITVTSANTKAVTKKYTKEFFTSIFESVEVNAINLDSSESMKYEIIAKEE